MRSNSDDVASRVIDAAIEANRPYAVFVGRSVEWMPVGGKRFAKIQRDPARMALCAGVFDESSSLAEINEAIALCR